MKGRRVLPIALALCMVLGSLPGDLLGGVSRVQAAAIEENTNGADTVSGNEAQTPGTLVTPDAAENNLVTTPQPEVQPYAADVPTTISTSDAGTVVGLHWDLSNAEVKEYTEDFTMGGITIKGASNRIFQVKEGTPVDLNGVQVTKYMNSKGGANNSGRYVILTLTSSAAIRVWSRSTAGERTISVKDGNGNAATDVDGKAVAALKACDVNDPVGEDETAVLPAGTYRLWPDGNLDIYMVEVIPGLDMAKDLVSVAAGESTASITAGDFEFLAKSGKAVAVKEGLSVSSDDGKTFTKAFDLKGSGDKTYRAIKFSLDAASALNIYALSGNATDARTLKIENEDGSFTKEISAAGKGEETFVAASEVDLQAGTYYVYSKSGGITVYDISVKSEEPEKTPWADVPTPEITNVTTDINGNVVVDFTASIDKYAGAENVVILMLEDGFEFASSVVKTQKTTSVTFAPLRSGNYSFKAIAKRSGEADKISAEYAFDGYVLPVRKPIVEMKQNRGNGTVYLDWINVEGGDYFNVFYKESSSADYIEAASNATEGHYTFTGLTAGTSYDFKIEAVRTSDNYVATYEEKNFMVTADKEQKWYFGTVGSAQNTDAEVYNADGSSAQSVHMKTDDASVDAGTHKGIEPAAVDIVNTDKYITFTGSGNGKISDGEEGFQYFYTMLDPNKDNFELTATFEITDLVKSEFDNQTGYGIIATDMLGYNYYGIKGLWIKHKQLNSVSTQCYGLKRFIGQRNISGYVSCDATSVEGVTRETYQTQFKNTPSPTAFQVGDKYTFTLKKTDDAYISICNGEEIAWENTGITSVQEDGSICVGLFTARNAGVKITDIQFSTSDSTGVTSVEKTDTITPSATVLSSGTANTSTYEYIYHPNVAGQLTVAASDGTVVYDEAVAAYDVVKVPVPVSIGDNTITSSLVPDKSQSLTNYDTITKTTKVSYQVFRKGIGNLYVSPDGSADGDGTSSNPLDVATAVKYVAPGQKIILLNGTYTGGAVSIGRSVSGTADKHIVMAAEEAGKVIFEGMGISLVGSYWDIYGIYVHYPSAVGIQICGNYNTVEMCTVEGSKNTGIQISRSGSVDREPALKSLMWPSYNLVKNCESFDNCDAGRNDADGFAAKLTCGEGNVFYGCIAHNNIDDGWDLFAKAISGEIGQVTIENCVAYNNGWLTFEKGQKDLYGEGNGFKLGGNDMYGGHILKNSVSFGNIAKGITSNSCPDCKVYNCTSYGNAVEGSYAFQFATKASNRQQWVVEGLISATTTASEADFIPYSFHTEDNYFFDGKTSHNNQGVNVSDDWFESVDVSVVPTRNEDGTINMHGLLVLTAAAPANSGARLDTTSDAAKSVNPLGTVPKDDNEIYDDGSDDDDDDDDDSNGGGGAAFSDEEEIVDVDWNTVAGNVDTAVKSKTAQNLDITSGDRFEVPVNVLNKIAGKNVTLALHAGGGLTFSISGKDVKKATAPFKMAVSRANVIPASAANPVIANAQTYKMFSMEDKSAYPYRVNVHVNLGAENAGKTAYLYYYDEKSGSMKLSGSFRITSTGQAMFALNRGDEYIITVAGKPAAISGKYVVEKGDSLSYIAKKAGVSLKKLVEANPQIKNVNMIHPGQEINLP